METYGTYNPQKSTSLARSLQVNQKDLIEPRPRLTSVSTSAQKKKKEDMEPAENSFEAALSSLAALTALQPQLTGASHLIKATKRLIEEKTMTLALTSRSRSSSPSDNVNYLPALAKIRGELQRSNIDAAQVDAIIDEQL